MVKVKKEKLSLEEMLEQALVKEEDKPYEVPGNWVWVRLGSICCNVQYGYTAKASLDKIGPKLLRITDIQDEFVDWVNVPYCSISSSDYQKFSIKINDIVVARTGATTGKSYLISENIESVFASYLIRVSLTKKLNFKFLYKFMQSNMYWDQIIDLAQGIAQPGVNATKLQSMSFALPPLSEQHRIVEVIESLFEKLDAAKELAQNALESFENRKSAILHKAFIGELTVNWREENKNNENNLLTDILKYYTESGVKKNIKNILEFQDLKLQINNIENSLWYKCSIGAIGVVLNGSTPSRQNLNFWNGDISWVSSGEVRNNIIGITKERISQVGYDNSSVKMLPVGTVLIAMIGEGKTRGKSAILNIDATINQNIAAIDVSHKKVESKFIWYWLQKQYQNNRQKGNGTGPKALNCQRVRELDFILPPLAEQKEIVRILDNLLEKEQLAKELCDVIEKIDLMKKAILARVFRGELGTNDPEEESAVELLKLVLKENI